MLRNLPKRLMPTLSDLHGLIDTCAQELAAELPHERVQIAALSSAVKSLMTRTLAASPDVREYSRVLDLCHAIDRDPSCHPSEPIASAVDACRARALAALLQRVHDDKMRSAHAEGGDVKAASREWRMALRIAEWVRANDERIPSSFGPEWLEQHADAAFVHAAKQYIYDLGKNAFAWERFALLLPEHVRSRFDPTKVPLAVPSAFGNEDEAKGFLQAFLRHYDLQPQDLVDRARHPELRKLPAFLKLVKYFGVPMEGEEGKFQNSPDTEGRNDTDDSDSHHE